MANKDAQAIARGTGLALPATLLGNGLLLLLDMYLGNHLPTEDFGSYKSTLRLLTLLGLIGQLGLENALLRRVAAGEAPEGSLKQGLWGALGFTTILMGAGLLLVGPLSQFLGIDTIVLWVLLPSLPLAALRLVGVTASQALRGLLDRVFVLLLLWPVVQLLVAGALVPQQGLLGAATAYAVAMGMGALAAFLLSGRRKQGLWPAVWQAQAVPLWQLLAFSWPLWLQSVLSGASSYIEQILLPGLNSAHEAGIYGPVATLAPLFGLPLGTLNGMFAPIIAERHAAGDIKGLSTLYQTVTRWALILSLPPTLICCFQAESVLSLWGPDKIAAAMALRVVAGSWFVGTLVGSVNYLLMMSGHPRATLFPALVAMLLNLSLSAFLVPAWGATGAGLAHGAAALSGNLLSLWSVWRLLKLHPIHRGLFRPLLAAIPAGLVAFGINSLSLPPLIALSIGGLAVGIILVLGIVLLGLDTEDRALLKRVAGRFIK